MPTFKVGYQEGQRVGYNQGYSQGYQDGLLKGEEMYGGRGSPKSVSPQRKKQARKLSAWQKYIKNKRNHIKYRDGKLNLKKMGVEFRRKKRR